jgi:Na+-transporting NADH:ubiquinone oxidoreductase subunit NqrF
MVIEALLLTVIMLQLLRLNLVLPSIALQLFSRKSLLSIGFAKLKSSRVIVQRGVCADAGDRLLGGTLCHAFAQPSHCDPTHSTIGLRQAKTRAPRHR